MNNNENKKTDKGKEKGGYGAFILLILAFVMISIMAVAIAKRFSDNKEPAVTASGDLAENPVTEDLVEGEADPVEETEPEEEILPEEEEEVTFSLKDWKEDHIKVKGIYVSGAMAGTSDSMNSLIDLIDDTDLNTMVIDVKNDNGKISYSMDLTKVTDMGNNAGYIKDIDALMARLKEDNIYTIARIVCFKDPELAEKYPDLALMTSQGKNVKGGDGMAWVNPYKQEVWEYITDVALMAAKSGFDEIQFDYVRFPVISDADYKGLDKDYSKKDCLTDFLSYAADKLHKENVVLGVDLFGTVILSDEDAENIGQDYATIGSKVDVLCPMVYPSHFAGGCFGIKVPDANPHDTVLKSMEKSVERLSNIDEEERALVRPWLQAFTASWVEGHISYNKKEIKAQIKAVEEAGYEEWILWNAKNKYSVYR